jgi:hypothetical protein
VICEKYFFLFGAACGYVDTRQIHRPWHASGDAR